MQLKINILLWYSDSHMDVWRRRVAMGRDGEWWWWREGASVGGWWWRVTRDLGATESGGVKLFISIMSYNILKQWKR